MTSCQRDNLIYDLMLAGTCGIVVALMALANHIDRWLP